jgi:hypothetical protein
MIFFDKHGGNTVHLCRLCAEVVDADSHGVCVKGSGPGQCETCEDVGVVAGYLTNMTANEIRIALVKQNWPKGKPGVLPHGGIDITILSGAIKLLDRSLGPKMIGNDGGRSQAFMESLAVVQYAYEQLDDDAAAIKRRKKREIDRVFREAVEPG